MSENWLKSLTQVGAGAIGLRDMIPSNRFNQICDITVNLVHNGKQGKNIQQGRVTLNALMSSKEINARPQTSTPIDPMPSKQPDKAETMADKPGMRIASFMDQVR